MKKARIMLAGLVVMAALGGALAFKAHKGAGPIWCSGRETTTGMCMEISDAYYTPNELGVYFCNNVKNAGCRVRAVVIGKK